MGIQLLTVQIHSPEQLEKEQGEYANWNSFNTEMLRRLFDSPEVAEEYSRFYGAVYSIVQSIHQQIEDYRKNVKDKTGRLERIKGRLPLYEEPKQANVIGDVGRPGVMITGNKVFIVHGRDEGVKQTVARFVEKLDLEPVILHEQSNRGRTLIEKFEQHSGVAFAVVLFTPDDVGGLATEPDRLSLRARQNVVMELGFFLAKLGRERVCVVCKGDVERPSDYDGVVYLQLDDPGMWRLLLARELKASGIAVDLNKAMA